MRVDAGAVSGHGAGEHGFSLVELLVAVVAAVAVIGATLVVSVRFSHQRQADTELQLAFQACVNSLEELRALPIAQVAALDGIGFAVPGTNGSGNALQPVPGDPDGLPGVFTVVVDQTAGGRTLYRVSASVVWQGTSARRRCQLETLIGARS